MGGKLVKQLKQVLAPDPYGPETREEALLDAAYYGEADRVRELLDLYPDIDINRADPYSGRTSVHHACAPENKEIMAIFLSHRGEHKADFTRRDKEGFTVTELSLNYHHYDPDMALDSASTVHHFEEKSLYVSEANSKLPSDRHLALVRDTQELMEYPARHPEYSQIGFLVPNPNTMKTARDGHLSPFLFDRRMDPFNDCKVETWIQMDSLGQVFLLPEKKSSGGSQKTVCIHFTTQRQVSTMGCDKDAIDLLTCIMKEYPEFFNFCKFHARASNILTPLSDEGSAMFRKLERISIARQADKKLPGLSLSQKKTYDNYRLKKLAEWQLKVFEATGVTPVKKIYFVEEWPLRLIQFVERYDVIHAIRTNTLGIPKHHGYQFMNEMKLRDPAVNPMLILENWDDPDKKYDFASDNWETVYEAFVKKHKEERDQEIQEVCKRVGLNGKSNEDLAEIIAQYDTYRSRRR